MKPRITRIGYGIYIFAIALFFLYTLFPSEALTAYLAHRLSGGRPDLTVSVDQVKPVLPPGLKLKPVRYTLNGQPLFELSQMSVRPQLLSFLKGGAVYDFDGRAYGGRVVGEAGPFDPDSGRPLGLDARLSAFQIDQIPALSRMVPQKLYGRLEGKLTMNDQEQLDANFTVAEARVQLRAPLFGLNALNFETVNAVLTFDGKQITLKKCAIKGTEMDGALTGGIQLDSRSGLATLNLEGTVSPHHALLAKIGNSLPARMLRGKDSIGFKLSGPMQNPAISFE